MSKNKTAKQQDTKPETTTSGGNCDHKSAENCK